MCPASRVSPLTAPAMVWAAASCAAVVSSRARGVEQPAEHAGENHHVVDLVGVVTAASCHHGGVLGSGFRFDFWVGVGQREDDHAGAADADEDVRVGQVFAQGCARPGWLGVCGQPAFRFGEAIPAGMHRPVAVVGRDAAGACLLE